MVLVEVVANIFLELVMEVVAEVEVVANIF